MAGKRAPFAHIGDHKARAIVARNIRRIRTRSGLTMKEVADLVGVTYQCYSFYETGVRRPPLDGVVSIARALRVPVADLLEGLDEGDAVSASTAEREPFLDHLFYRIERLPRPQQEVLKTVADGLWQAGRPADAPAAAAE